MSLIKFMTMLSQSDWSILNYIKYMYR